MYIVKEQDIVLSDIVARLCLGEVIVYPTETCYGLGCDATNQEAVSRLFDIKQRQKEKSVLMLMPDIAMAAQYALWNDTAQRLADRFWPGPLTLVLPVREDRALAAGVIGPHRTIALRVTGHLLAQELVTALGRPLVSTSANIESLESPYDVETIVEMFEHAVRQPSLIIDAGNLPDRPPSTIVAIEKTGLRVIRQGDILVNTV